MAKKRLADSIPPWSLSSRLLSQNIGWYHSNWVFILWSFWKWQGDVGKMPKSLKFIGLEVIKSQ